MKISKLFHWLYAFLMFLPVLALAPSLFYFAFNQQSQNYTDVQVNETYEYETNEVNSVDDLIEGNIYKYTYITNTSEQDNRSFIVCSKIYSPIYDLPINNTYQSRVYADGTSRYVWSIYNEGSTLYRTYNYTNNIEISFYFIYATPNATYQNLNINGRIAASDYLGEKTLEVVYSEQSPMNIFYTAVNYVYDMPVFSWAKNSFLALPITYVTGLFGMASTNVVNYYLSYWLAISIVYLVFDLVMYVPLLVHRWIDKGLIV